MARAVVLSFGDNEAAEAFVKMLDEVQSNEYPQVVGLAFQEMGLILASGAKTEAFVARPTLPGCTCGHGNKGWSKTKRFGWYVCPKCRRPSVYIIRDFIKNMIIGSGNNLLDELRAKEVEPLDFAPE